MFHTLTCWTQGFLAFRGSQMTLQPTTQTCLKWERPRSMFNAFPTGFVRLVFQKPTTSSSRLIILQTSMFWKYLRCSSIIYSLYIRIYIIPGSARPVPGRKFQKIKPIIGRWWPIGKFLRCGSNELLKLRCINEGANGGWDANEMTWKNPCTTDRMNQWINDWVNSWVDESMN